jgi:ketosteroid isomerase-like protein
MRIRRHRRVLARSVSPKARKTNTVPSLAAIEALVARQARAWERNDFALAAADWLPDGVLSAPNGTWRAADLPQAMAEVHRDLSELIVSITNVFASSDWRQVAIEWEWIATSKAAGARTTTHDAIIVELSHGKIRSWREYFDTAEAARPAGSP